LGVADFGDGKFVPIFSIKAVNTGKYEVIVNSLGVIFKNGDNLCYTGRNDGLPTSIKPGDARTFIRKPKDIAVFFNNANNPPKFLWAKDQTGKIYKGSVRKLAKRMKAWGKMDISNS